MCGKHNREKYNKKFRNIRRFFSFAVFSSQRFFHSTFCPILRFLYSSFFPIDVFYFSTFCHSQRFLQSTFFPVDVSYFSTVCPCRRFFYLWPFVLVGLFSIRHFVPFVVFYFVVLSIDIFLPSAFFTSTFCRSIAGGHCLKMPADSGSTSLAFSTLPPTLHAVTSPLWRTKCFCIF
jgi:hypothetical protein